eukprot:11962264-Alexandrium_andersonii.AAC.1
MALWPEGAAEWRDDAAHFDHGEQRLAGPCGEPPPLKDGPKPAMPNTLERFGLVGEECSGAKRKRALHDSVNHLPERDRN